MTRMYKRVFKCFLAFIAIGLWTASIPVSAEAPYSTFTRSSWGYEIYTQSAYNPIKAIGQDLYMEDPNNPGQRLYTSLSSPKDLFVTDNDDIYIADSGNNRIVHLSKDGQLLRVLDSPNSTLNKPEGVFVDDEGRIYIADTGNQRIVLLDQAGEFIREYTRPDSKFLADDYKFDPIKIVVDKRDFLYIVTLGGYQGMLQLDPEGGFQGFFGTNQAELSLTDRLKKLFYSQEMYEREQRKLPASINSATIDKDGFIYTVSSGPTLSKHQLKRLNFSGQNLLDKADDYAINSSGSTLSFGETRNISNTLQQPKLVDVAVSPNGNMTVIDAQFNFISQYDAYGNLLFFWRGSYSSSTLQVGLPKSLAAIASGSDNTLLIADDQENVIHVYQPTEFANLVYQANSLMLEGKYGESEQMWGQVLRYHSNFPIAQLGMAKAAYHSGDYPTAMKMFRNAGVQKGYSDAFWQIRLGWFQKHFSTIATIVLVVSLLAIGSERVTRHPKFKLLMKWRRPRKWPQLAEQLKHAFYILRHPIDGFTALRFENKGSYASVILLLIFVFGSILFSNIYTSFTFNKFEIYTVNAGSLFIQTFAIWLLWVICHYLIGSIQRGEARFRDVFIGSAYTLTPFIIIGLPMTLLSIVMTGSEASIYHFMNTAMTIWIILLFIWKVQSLQNYSVGETAVNIFSTLFTMIVVGVLVFITFGLTSDLIDFVRSIYMEVRLR